MDPDEMKDLFLLELISLDPVDPQKDKSALLSLTPSEDNSDQDEHKVEEVEKDLLTMTTLMKELPMKSLMATTSRTWSPSPRPTTSKLWGHSQNLRWR
jgi:hypothetical protein